MYKLFCIADDNGMLWNAEWGFVDGKNEDPFTIYEEQELERIELPDGGHWEEVD